MDADPADQQQEAPIPAPSSMSDTGADAGSEAPASTNPRKRKKASRACDYCHTNHQPCDNGKPRCSVCEKHNKDCAYLRPTKRRGPQKGYRTALNTYKESAAAWGAVLGAIPGLDALIEGHLRSDQGRGVLKAVKDASQQDPLIQRWQSSNLFKTFFPNANCDAAATAGSVAGGDAGEDEDSQPPQTDLYSAAAGGPRLLKQQDSYQLREQHPLLQQQLAQHQPHQFLTPMSPIPSGFMFGGLDPAMDTKGFIGQQHQQFPVHRGGSTSLSDIVANDAARSTSHVSQTLAPLGFAPNETIADFYDLGSNPEQPMQSADFDLPMGSSITDADQRVFYELLMGRSFDISSQQS